MPIIADGNWPFFVDAVSSHVTIEGIHFVGPSPGAIWVYAINGLTIANCRIEGVQPTVEFGMQAGQATALSSGISILSDPHPPSNANPGTPQNFSGTLAILNNDIDMGATADALFLGVTIFSAGVSPDHEVDIYISGNSIRNVTEPAFGLRGIGGRAYIERNAVVTGAVTGPSAAPDAIRIVGPGSYLIAHNTVDCGWTNGGASAINGIGTGANRSTSNAVILDNDVNMSAPDGSAFSATSAGIQIRGFAQGNSVLNNRLRGRASAALAVNVQNAGIPGNNTFVANDLQGFMPSLAQIVVDVGVTNTVIVGRQNGVQDQGSGTVVIPMQ
jgi:hypothetical protein